MNKSEYEGHLQKLRALYKMAKMAKNQKRMVELCEEAGKFKDEWKDALGEDKPLTAEEVAEILDGTIISDNS